MILDYYHILVLLATVMQIFRHYEQKKMSDKFDKETIALSRFLFFFPFCCIYLMLFKLSMQFISICLLIAFLQVFGNLLLLHSFSKKNFAISVALVHTELMQAAIIGYIFFGQSISIIIIFAIIIILFGVFMLSNIKYQKSISFDRNIAYALLSATCFSFTAFFVKYANNILINQNKGYSYFESSLSVLMVVIFWCNILLGCRKLLKGNIYKDLCKLINSETRISFIKISFLSFLTSVLWFFCYAIGDVVIVKGISQLEIVWAILISHHFLKEKFNKKEIYGITILLLGLAILISEKYWFN